MSADLHIHVFEPPLEERHLKVFFSNVFGSKHYTFPKFPSREGEDEAHDLVSKTPEVWIGEVSWLKAALFEKPEDFVPNAVQEINDIIGEDLPLIDDSLIARCYEALKKPQTTGQGYRVADVEEVRAFLEQHKGKPCFTVSW